jgi:hypothetical protein
LRILWILQILIIANIDNCEYWLLRLLLVCKYYEYAQKLKKPKRTKNMYIFCKYLIIFFVVGVNNNYAQVTTRQTNNSNYTLSNFFLPNTKHHSKNTKMQKEKHKLVQYHNFRYLYLYIIKFIANKIVIYEMWLPLEWQENNENR